MSELALLKDSPAFFKALVQEGLESAQVKVSPPVGEYLVKLLMFYVFSDHLFSISPSGKKQLKNFGRALFAKPLLSHCSERKFKENGGYELVYQWFF